jgi:hypothetical protein
MEPKTFYDDFLARLDSLESRARAAGITLTHMCRDAGIARATPDRWRKSAPKSIRAIDELEKAVVAAESAAK